MIYRFRLRKNFKSVLIPTTAVVLVGAAIAVAVFINVLLGILALAVAGYISFHIVRFFVRTLQSHVRTSEDGLVCATSMGTESSISWTDVTHTGWYTTDTGYRELFVYAEKDDRLLSIPSQYEDMDKLANEILTSTDLAPLSFAGEEADGLADALRRHVAPEEEIIEDDLESADNAE